jgi:hypothetical protein
VQTESHNEEYGSAGGDVNSGVGCEGRREHLSGINLKHRCSGMFMSQLQWGDHAHCLRGEPHNGICFLGSFENCWAWYLFSYKHNCTLSRQETTKSLHSCHPQKGPVGSQFHAV